MLARCQGNLEGSFTSRYPVVQIVSVQQKRCVLGDTNDGQFSALDKVQKRPRAHA